MSSLPVPVSPVISTVESIGATLDTYDRTVRSGGEKPTISSRRSLAAVTSITAQTYSAPPVASSWTACATTFTSRLVAVSPDAVMSCLLSTDLPRAVGNHRAVPEVVTWAGLRTRFSLRTNAYSERGLHLRRVRYSDADRNPADVCGGTS